MKRAETFFRGLTAGDVVHRTAFVLKQEMCLDRAAHLLLRRRLGAAAVADSSGQCVGVLSAVDILRWSLDEHRPDPNRVESTECVWCDWQLVDVESTGRDGVAHYMVRDPLLVTRDTHLVEVAEILLGSHPRPVVMVDEERRPLGVVSSKDVLAGLAFSIEHPPEEDSAHWSSGDHALTASTVGSDIGQDLAELAHVR